MRHKRHEDHAYGYHFGALGLFIELILIVTFSNRFLTKG